MDRNLIAAALALLWLVAAGACSTSAGSASDGRGRLNGGDSSTRVRLASPTDDLPGLSNFAKVSPVLYRGAQPEPAGYAQLKKQGIKTVVNLRTSRSDREKMRGQGLRYVELRVPPQDLSDEHVVAFLALAADPANQPLFLHCKHGADRTGTMVAVYRMLEQGWSRDDALAELPRFGFHRVWVNLKRYVEGVDVERLRKRLENAEAPAVETIP